MNMLEQAEETAARLCGGLLTLEVAQCRAALAAIKRVAHTPGSTTGFDGDASAWTKAAALSLRTKSERVAGARSARCIGRLLFVLNDSLDLGVRRACSRGEATVLARDEGLPRTVRRRRGLSC